MQLLRSGIKAPERGGGGLGRSSGFKVGNHEVKDGKMGIGKRKERRNMEAGFNEVTDRRALGWSVVKEMGLNMRGKKRSTEVSGLLSHPELGRHCRPCKGSYCYVCPPTFPVPLGQSDYSRKETHNFKLTRNTSTATATRLLPW